MGGRRAQLSVCLWREQRDYVILLVRAGWPAAAPASRSLTLANILAIAVTGDVQRVSGPWLGIWKRVGLVLAGLVRPCPVRLPPLPLDASRAAARFWGFLPHYLGVRQPGAPLPLVAPRLQELSSAYGPRIDHGTIVDGKGWLARQGLLVHVGDAPGTFGNPTKLWRVAAFGEFRGLSAARKTREFGGNPSAAAFREPWPEEEPEP